MSVRRACRIAALVLAAAPAAASAQAPDADSLFAAGRLAEARAAYERRSAADPGDRAARVRLGLLALWENRLPAADSLLGRALAADPDDRAALEGLAESRYRQGRTAEAAAFFRRLGRAGLADKVVSLAAPYETSMPEGGARLDFLPGAVLPVVEVGVNGRPVLFLVDTGAGETIVDEEFATTVNARTFGRDSGAYAAGRVATFAHGTVDSIRLGGIVVRNVPVHLQSTVAYAPAAGGRPVSGILGIGILSRFRSTFDFAAGAIELRAPSSGGEEGCVSLPFWLLGDHFVTTPGAVGPVETLLVFDTGLALPGGALVPAASVLAEAGIEPGGTPVEGVGGAGRMTVTPFTLERLRVGPLVRDGVLAVAGAFPPTLERRFGPRIGGLLSHGFFPGQRVTLDFRAMRLLVTPAGG